MKDVRILKISQNIFNNKLLKKETSSQSNKKYFTDEFVEELFKVFQKDDIESQEKFVQQGLDDYGHHDIVYQFLSLNTENLKYCIQAYTKDKEINGKDNALSSFISKKGHGKIRPILKKVHCSI